MRDAFVAALTRYVETAPKTMLITGDLGFGVLDAFARRFPDNFLNAGVAEQNMTALAAGLALEGWKVFTYSIANFPTLRCLEHIRNDLCYHELDVSIVSIGAGFSYGGLGMSHFATEDLAIMRALPNMRVIAPTELWEIDDLLPQMAAAGGPFYLRIDKSAGGQARREGERAELGKMRRLREGADVTLVAVGAILREALAAAQTLAGEGIEARVLAVHALKPFDVEEALAAARETGGVVAIEEHTKLGGLAGALAETFLDAGAPPRFFRRIGLDDCFPTVVGDQNFLRRAYAMDAAAIVKEAQAGLARAR